MYLERIFEAAYRGMMIKKNASDESIKLLEKLKKEYPNLNNIPSLKETRAFFEKVVPYLVYTVTYKCFSLKQCGSMSSTFGAIANQNGFPTMQGGTGNHFFNIMITQEGFVVADLTAAQFDYYHWSKNNDLDPEDYDSLHMYLENIIKNPFKATRFYLTEKIDTDYLTVPPSTLATGDKVVSDMPLLQKRLNRMIKKDNVDWGAETDPSAADEIHPQSDTNKYYPRSKE